jgi:hypothetical protein
MDTYTQAIQEIIKHQQAIIGPMALDQAKKVTGLEVVAGGAVRVKGSGREILGKLVEQYSKLFGRASIEVCRDALRETKPQLTHDQLPANLQ